MKITLTKRFWSKVKKTRTCWLWTGHLINGRYGDIWVNEHGKKELAHRAAWFLATGKWPTKLTLHKCNVKRCVRKSHLYQGTHSNNANDALSIGVGNTTGMGAGERNRAKRNCPKGHPYSGSNLSLYKRGNHTFRRCRECMRADCRRRNERRSKSSHV